LRAVVFGNGQEGTLDVPFMPVNADMQTGDQLVTSGIDGTYPPGLPVATISKVERNAAYPFAKISCTPSAGTDRERQVLILTAVQSAPIPPRPQEAPPPVKHGKR
jgi:rod shape-determining protein MreC